MKSTSQIERRIAKLEAYLGKDHPRTPHWDIEAAEHELEILRWVLYK